MTNEDLKDVIDRGFARMETRFDALDGRVRLTEQGIVRLDAVIEERATQATRWGGLVGSIGGFIGGLISGVFGGRG